MALPSEWDDRVLQRTYRDDRDLPMTGSVTITPTVPYVEAMNEATAWFTRPVKVELDGNGTATLTVRVADPDMRQHDYTHKVVEVLEYQDVAGQDTPPLVRNEYNIHVPPGPDPLLYGALAPVPAGQGVVIVDGLEGPQGPPGDDGPPGADGAPGPPGASAFEVWLEDNPGGTEADFFLSLKGDPGDVSGLAAVATSGLSTDLTDYVEPIAATDRQTEGILADRVMLQVRYSGSAYEAAADTTRLCHVFTGPTTSDPGPASNEDDIWFSYVLP